MPPQTVVHCLLAILAVQNSQWAPLNTESAQSCKDCFAGCSTTSTLAGERAARAGNEESHIPCVACVGCRVACQPCWVSQSASLCGLEEMSSHTSHHLHVPLRHSSGCEAIAHALPALYYCQGSITALADCRLQQDRQYLNMLKLNCNLVTILP